MQDYLHFLKKARGIIKQDWFQRFIQKSINYSKYGNIYFERYESKIKYSDYLNAVNRAKT